MYSKRIGPFHHPTNPKNTHDYWVRAYLERDNVFLIEKDAGLESAEYTVDLSQTIRGRICNCPHHTNRHISCFHMGFAKEAKETYLLWKRMGWV